jgi:hypothetical protein
MTVRADSAQAILGFSLEERTAYYPAKDLNMDTDFLLSKSLANSRPSSTLSRIYFADIYFGMNESLDGIPQHLACFVSSNQGLTLIHISAQHKHFLRRNCVVRVTNTTQLS